MKLLNSEYLLDEYHLIVKEKRKEIRVARFQINLGLKEAATSLYFVSETKSKKNLPSNQLLADKMTNSH